MSGKKSAFFEKGHLAKSTAEETLNRYVNNKIASFHLNSPGESRLFCPGIIENKESFKLRTAQGIIDLILGHFDVMTRDKQVLVMVGHHNVIHEFMRVFNRNEHVEKKPVYCWACAVEVELDIAVL